MVQDGNQQEFSSTAGPTTSRIFGALLIAIAVLTTWGCGSSNSGGTQPPPPPGYTAIDAPGAGTTAGMGTEVLAVNARGDVVGVFKDSNNMFHGFLRTAAGTFTTLDAPDVGSSNTFPTAINSSGTVAGSFADASSVGHVFLRTSAGTYTTIDPPNSVSTGFGGLNDAGEITGYFSDTSTSSLRNFVRAPDGTFTVFNGPNPMPSQVGPGKINAAGTFAGSDVDTNGVFHGLLRAADGTQTTFDAPGAGTANKEGTLAIGINASGVALGAAIAPGVQHGFVRAADNTYTTFDPPGPPAFGLVAQNINDSGSIVGGYKDAGGAYHGYLRAPDGTITTLDDPKALIASGSGTFATDINSSGVIVGVYFDSSN